MDPQNSTTATVLYFQKVCKLVYLCCGTNFWFEAPKMSPKFLKIYGKIFKVLEVVLVCFLASEWGSLLTQKNLTEKRRWNMWIFPIAHTVMYCVYISVLYHRDQIRRLVFTLTVTLGLYHDENVERAMHKKITSYSIALAIICSSALAFQGLEVCVEAITTNATFTIVTTFWPDVEDHRPVAGAARVVSYFLWWIFTVRTLSCYFIILAVTICMSHQFISLNNYFLSLHDIFEGDGSQDDKEKRYEDALKVGIKMHSLSLWCVRQTQDTCGIAFSGQIVMNISVLFSTMMQMMRAERSLVNVVPIVCVAGSVLIGTGIFMWNAGDVTVEASRLPTAIFLSGWHRCSASTLRVRKLVSIAVAHAQKPVVMTVMGVVELSYQSYVSIVKSSYSLFSVIY